jgi:hypothetical protein
MKLLKFKKFNLNELNKSIDLPLLIENKIYKMKLDEHLLECKLSEYGWSTHREIIHYEFTILKSDTDKYPKGGMFILGLDFNDKDNTFHLYPYYNDVNHKLISMSEKTCKAHIKII